MEIGKLITDLQQNYEPDDFVIADIFARTQYYGFDENEDEVLCTKEEWADVVHDYNTATRIYLEQMELMAELVQDKINERYIK